jgi:hypothetical protein
MGNSIPTQIRYDDKAQKGHCLMLYEEGKKAKKMGMS